MRWFNPCILFILTIRAILSNQCQNKMPPPQHNFCIQPWHKTVPPHPTLKPNSHSPRFHQSTHSWRQSLLTTIQTSQLRKDELNANNQQTPSNTNTDFTINGSHPHSAQSISLVSFVRDDQWNQRDYQLRRLLSNDAGPTTLHGLLKFLLSFKH